MTIPKWRGPWIGKVADAPAGIPAAGTYITIPSAVLVGYTWTLVSGSPLSGVWRVGVGGQKILAFDFNGGLVYLNGSLTPTAILDLPAGFTCLTAAGSFTLSDGGGVAWSNDPAGEFNYGNHAYGTQLHTVNSEPSIWMPGTIGDVQQQGFVLYCTNDTGGIVQLDTYQAGGSGIPLISGNYEVV